MVLARSWSRRVTPLAASFPARGFALTRGQGRADHRGRGNGDRRCLCPPLRGRGCRVFISDIHKARLERTADDLGVARWCAT